MDAEEFFSTLMDRLENLSKGTKHESMIKNSFGGKSVQQLIGKETCDHVSERIEPLLHLQLQVINKRSV
jgi:hypothetical protein